MYVNVKNDFVNTVPEIFSKNLITENQQHCLWYRTVFFEIFFDKRSRISQLTYKTCGRASAIVVHSHVVTGGRRKICRKIVCSGRLAHGYISILSHVFICSS